MHVMREQKRCAEKTSVWDQTLDKIQFTMDGENWSGWRERVNYYI